MKYVVATIVELILSVFFFSLAHIAYRQSIAMIANMHWDEIVVYGTVCFAFGLITLSFVVVVLLFTWVKITDEKKN